MASHRSMARIEELEAWGRNTPPPPLKLQTRFVNIYKIHKAILTSKQAIALTSANPNFKAK